MTEDRLRVIAVGGAGAMGRWAVRTIAHLGSASALTVADIDVDRANRVADSVGGPCRALALDVSDMAAMTEAFGEHDVVVNTMGPFATFAAPIIRASLDTGCHYLDINDDWQPTLEAFELEEVARERGLHVVLGLGGSPGVTNLCAVLAAEQLDDIEELHTGWKVSAASIVDEPGFPAPRTSAATEHWVHQCSGPIRAWVDGGYGDVAPVAPIELDFPGRGAVVAYTMGHPEPITLPRKYPQLKRSFNLQTGPAWLLDLLRAVGQAHGSGALSLHEAAERIADHPRPAKRGPSDPLPIEWALAIGEKDGTRRSVAVYPRHFHPGRMGANTSVPLAIGVELLRRGDLLDTGVQAPETAVRPRDFFDLLAPLTDPSLTSCDDLIEIATADAGDRSAIS